MNIKDWLYFATSKLKNISSSPNLDAEIMLSHVLKKNRSWLVCYDSVLLNKYNLKKLKNLLQRRICKEPIAYLINKKEFWSLSLMVSYFTLIPRSDTEILVETALFYLSNFKSSLVLDLGTGCGAIALALASMRLDCFFLGVDCSYESVMLAKKNAFHLGFKNVAFFHSIWFSKINCYFHMIVSNPPYVSLNEIQFLDKEVLFEPYIALISEDNGFSAIHYIIKNSIKYLLSGGWLVIEHGSTQKLIVQNLFYKYNYVNIKTYLDFSGLDRVTVGRKK